MDTSPVQIEVTQQGAILLNNAILHAQSEGIALIAVDMESKRGEIGMIGGGDNYPPELGLFATDDSCDLNREVLRDMPTLIAFPEYIGWDVWSASISKYTIYVCLVKPRIH